MNHRRIFLRLLLIAVLLHACIGLPRHEAEHLRAMGGAGLATVGMAQEDTSRHSKPMHAQEHGPCAGCVAFAQPAALPGGMALPLPETGSGGNCLPPAAALALVPSPDRWPFASRDPPFLPA
ncbi:hypothetical protein [Acidovorax sp. NCPPB 3576]|uniref:hypothetical protein n=1 Tax=Acidovorax sp. NCPPB 3576 TaxID=2940488 RepID=UPI0023494424|nr:hypothetical protein [Acidovorax sp. NCPPB 3576]WCM89260.1 hypothetical protein M5C98_04205 [Acidovorax sp. NCPPB 3576]